MEFRLRQSLWAHVIIASGLSCLSLAQSTSPDGTAQVTRAVGTIKATQSDTLVLTPDAGGELTAKLTGTTKILRVPPGEKDLKNATPLQAQDLQAGDRVLVRGTASADGHILTALSVIVMKQADVSAKQEHDREDWQKRGVGGLVTAAAAGTITVSSAGAAGSHDILIHTSPKTTARRYAPDSVKFDDAKPAPVDQIKPGDQLRARGNRNADGSELTAEEIVFGSFRNIAGTITAIDAASNSITVHDLIGKKTVLVKATPDSQIKKLPAEMAQRIAVRLKGGNGNGNGNDGSQGATPGQQPSPRDANASSHDPASARRSAGTQGQGSQGQGAEGQGQRGGGPPDLQRFLGRLPNSALTDLKNGDAVMIVSAQGEEPDTVTAITVLAGVEPILTSSPNRSAMMLSPWTLGGGGGEGEAAP